MSMTQESTTKRAPNGEQRRSQEVTIDLKLLYVVDYILRSMHKQWWVVKRLIETGDAKNVDLGSVTESLLWVEDEIRQLESLIRRK